MAISAIVHAVLLTIHFEPKMESWVKSWSTQQEIAVILNQESDDSNEQAKHIAQSNAKGGGEEEELHHEASSLVVWGPQNIIENQEEQEEGDEQRVKRLEAEVQSLMLHVKERAQMQEQQETQRGGEKQEKKQAASNRAAKIEEQYKEYASKPKKTFVGTDAKSSEMAIWIMVWQKKIEEKGALIYPQDGRHMKEGELIATVGIKRTGEIESVVIDESSGKKILDQVVRKIVKAAGPYDPFTEAMRAKTDILYITRKWIFKPGNAKLEAVEPA